ncbi:unnamed protein product, partial [Discosporangium mesarthrocarpum]
GGENRFKFKGKRSRARAVDVDVSHKIRADGYLDADAAQEPEVEGGSFFREELERGKELNTTPTFKRFYYQVWPLVQSLPELLYHAKTVVNMLLSLLEKPDVVVQSGEQVLQLLSVLGRDLQGSFFPFFPRVSVTLVSLMESDSVAPEACGRILRCLGFLLKFVSRPLADDIDTLKALYPPLLGHRKDFVRRLAAQSLAPALRRLKPKVMRRHARTLVGALAAGAKGGGGGEGEEEGDHRNMSRVRDTLDGCSQLLFYTAKGVQGRMHSQAPTLLRVLLESIQPKKKSSKGTADGSGQVERGWKGKEERGKRELDTLGETKREWCFELVKGVLDLLVNHIRSPYSGEVWMELHLSLGMALGCYRAALVSPTATDTVARGRALDPRKGKEAGFAQSPGWGSACAEGLECAALRRQVILMSRTMGHMGGILLREEAVAVEQAALVAEALRDLTAPGIFWAPATSPGCRVAVVELLSASLHALHRQAKLRVAIPAAVSAAVAGPPPGTLLSGAGAGWEVRAHPAVWLCKTLLGDEGDERTGNRPPPALVTRALVLPAVLEACAGPLSGNRELVLEVLVRLMHGTSVELAMGTGEEEWGTGQRRSDGIDEEEEKEEEEAERGVMGTERNVLGRVCRGLPVEPETAQKVCNCVCVSVLLVELYSRGKSIVFFTAEGGEGERDPTPALVAEVSQGASALRCMPSLVGAMPTSGRCRERAIRSGLKVVERFMHALEPIPGTGEAPVYGGGGEGGGSSSGGGNGEGEEEGKGKKGRGKDKGKEGKGSSPTRGPWEGEGGEGRGTVCGELVVARALALEAGVGMCCLLPVGEEGHTEDGLVSRSLSSWHERTMLLLQASPSSVATLRAMALLLQATRLTFPAKEKNNPVVSNPAKNGAGGRGGGGFSRGVVSAEASLPVLSILRPNLASPSHLLRLATIRVLACYDPLPFGWRDNTGEGEGTLAAMVEPCLMMELLAGVEALPVSLEAERDLSWRLGRLEVMAASGKLPLPYASTAATHALGLLRVKFSTVWPRAIAVLGALCSGVAREQRNVVWGAVRTGLRGVMQPPPERVTMGKDSVSVPTSPVTATLPIKDEGSTPASPCFPPPSSPSSSSPTHPLLRQWTLELLSEAARLDRGPAAEVDLPAALLGIFSDRVVKRGLRPNPGEVPVWASTDPDTAFTQVWSILSKCPELLQEHSRFIVPMFLGMIEFQFLSPSGFPQNCEVRGVGLRSHLSESEREEEGPGGWERGHKPNRRSVCTRTAAVLRVLAEAPGPKSLYKEGVLFSLHRALLLASDHEVAGLALKCMLAYKPPYLENLLGLADDSSFREQLVRFSLRGTTDKTEESSYAHPSSRDRRKGGGDGVLPSGGDKPSPIDPRHRPLLLPVVVRLVYGRLTAWGPKGKTGGHGGPAARRAAVLTFLSGLSSEELAELFSLMFRPFSAEAGAGQEGVGDDSGGGEAQGRGGGGERAAGGVRRVGVREVAQVSTAYQVGFLRMVKDVSKQLGYGALPYVGGMLRLVLVLLQISSNRADSSRRMAVDHNAHNRQERALDTVEEMEEEMEDLTEAGGGGWGGKEGISAVVSQGHPRGRRAVTPGALRTLCLRALCELMSQFSGDFNLVPYHSGIWSPLSTPISGLAASTVGAVRPPALLALAVVIAEGGEPLLAMLDDTKTTAPGSRAVSGSSGQGQALVPAVLDCLSAGSSSGRPVGQAVMGQVLTFVERLLDYNGGRILEPHLNRLITNFAARLQGATTGGSGPGSGSGTAADSGGRGGSWDAETERGLAILSRVAGMAVAEAEGGGGKVSVSVSAHPHPALDAGSISQLIELLIPFLRPDRRSASEGVKCSVLGTVAALAGRADRAGALRAWLALCQLLGPSGPRPSVATAPPTRQQLVGALEALAARGDLGGAAGPAVNLLSGLNAFDPSTLDEFNYQLVVPAFNSLSEGSGWADVVEAEGGREFKQGPEESEEEPSRLGGASAAAAIVHHCRHTLHGDDVALRGAAVAAMKRLINEAVKHIRGEDEGDVGQAPTPTKRSRSPWEILIRRAVMPGLRAGIAFRSEGARKGFITVLREAVVSFGAKKEEDYGQTGVAAAVGGGGGGVWAIVPVDLGVLASEADPEVDFFLNSCHIQVHRQARALARARGASRTSDWGLVDQAVALVGALAQHMPWYHYNAILRGLMVRIRRGRKENKAGGGGGAEEGAERERAQVRAMCAVLDSFHFEIRAPTTAAGAMAGLTAGGGASEEKTSSSLSTAVEKAAATPLSTGDAVWCAVTERLIGSLRGLLTVEENIKAGGKGKVLRAPVALALLKLLRRLPAEVFNLQLPPLLMTICGTLRSRDSSVRDTARDTLAKMAVDLGPEYLKQIITELKSILMTGYQLHVRTFTLHSVLKAMCGSYSPPNPPSADVFEAQVSTGGLTGVAMPTPQEELQHVGRGDQVGGGGSAVASAGVSPLVRPPFDLCIGEIVELLMEDLFGESAASKEAEGHNVGQAKLKEAKGNKALDCFEILGRMLLFRPTYTTWAPEDPASVSSVHALVGPLLTLLEGCENPREVSKANEALLRLGIGLASNPSVTEVEMLLYVHATIAPFLQPQVCSREGEGDGSDSNSDSDSDSDSSGDETRGAAATAGSRGGHPLPFCPTITSQWMVSDSGAQGHTRAAAVGEKRRREWESIRVQDGANAPKHTGKDRHDSRRPRKKPLATNGMGSKRLQSLSDPAALGAVKLALGLLHARLRAEAVNQGGKGAGVMDRRNDKLRAMADPFVPLLAGCFENNPNSSVVLLALKSLGHLLRWDLPKMNKLAPFIGRAVLARLVRGGAEGMRGEMGQGCFKALSLLFKSHIDIFGGKGEGEGGREGGGTGKGKEKRKKKGQIGKAMFGLNAKQMRALLVLLQVAVAETEHQHATFSLIKAIVAQRIVLPEVYDLMTKLAELAVTSHRPTLRTTAGQTFLTFLIQYPLGEKRLQQHLNQVVKAVSYEHAEGRLAALKLCEQMFCRLPEPVLDQFSSVFYLALVVRLVNDPTAECRAAAALAVKALLSQVSGGIFHQLLDYTNKWFRQQGEEGTHRGQGEGEGEEGGG